MNSLTSHAWRPAFVAAGITLMVSGSQPGLTPLRRASTNPNPRRLPAPLSSVGPPSD